MKFATFLNLKSTGKLGFLFVIFKVLYFLSFKEHSQKFIDNLSIVIEGRIVFTSNNIDKVSAILLSLIQKF